jgi:hypothetical protein
MIFRYDAGLGNGTFEPLGGDHILQTIELESPIGSRVLVMVSAGMTLLGPSEGGSVGSSEAAVRLRGRVISRYMGQGEVLVDVLRFSDWHLAVSGGVRRDFDGSTQALSRLSLSRTTPGWSFAANVYATKSVSGAVVNPKYLPWASVTTSVGATAKVAPGVSLGMETVAADAESLLWSRGTGGAAIFLGPLASFALPDHRTRLTVSGGPILQPSGTFAPISTMIGKYAMPLHSGQTGYELRLAVSMGL